MANITFNANPLNTTELNFDLIIIVEDPLAEALREGLFSIVVIGAPMGIGDRPGLYNSPRKPSPPRKPGSKSRRGFYR